MRKMQLVVNFEIEGLDAGQAVDLRHEVEIKSIVELYDFIRREYCTPPRKLAALCEEVQD